jgi:hypothetical protein
MIAAPLNFFYHWGRMMEGKGIKRREKKIVE